MILDRIIDPIKSYSDYEIEVILPVALSSLIFWKMFELYLEWVFMNRDLPDYLHAKFQEETLFNN